MSFVEKDFPQYTWSARTLDWRLRYFEIYYSDAEKDSASSSIRRTTRPCSHSHVQFRSRGA